MKAKIGITCNYCPEENNYALRRYYADKVIAAGGIPAIIPPVDDNDYLRHWVTWCQGFILSGGGDINPGYWGEKPDKKLREMSSLRDKFELDLTKKVLKLKKPILGICRGCQLINVALGGSIYQHITSDINHEQKTPRHFYQHEIQLDKDSALHAIVSVDKIRVNSFHHQAVNRVAGVLKASAWALDGSIEAVEGTGENWIMGVQWHPECLQDSFSDAIFNDLIIRAKNHNTKS